MTHASIFDEAQTFWNTFINSTVMTLSSNYYAITNFKGYGNLNVTNCTLYVNLTATGTNAALISIGGGNITINTTMLNFSAKAQNIAGIAITCLYNLTLNRVVGVYNYT